MCKTPHSRNHCVDSKSVIKFGIAVQQGRDKNCPNKSNLPSRDSDPAESSQNSKWSLNLVLETQACTLNTTQRRERGGMLNFIFFRSGFHVFQPIKGNVKTRWFPIVSTTPERHTFLVRTERFHSVYTHRGSRPLSLFIISKHLK